MGVRREVTARERTSVLSGRGEGGWEGGRGQRKMTHAATKWDKVPGEQLMVKGRTPDA